VFDGVGYNWIDTLKKVVEDVISDKNMKEASSRFPFQTPTTKEEYYYRSLFSEHFPSQTAASCVPQEPSVACSTKIALEWDEAFKSLNEPSGRAISKVHEDAYDSGDLL
jgi:asparagine synthase (glutamine-hydrolysing)